MLTAKFEKGKDDDGNECEFVVIRLPRQNPPPVSSTGASLLVANSGGPASTGLKVDGQFVKVNVTATIPNPNKPGRKAS